MPKLGSLYRKYLSGSNLEGVITRVRIKKVYLVTVNPPPTFEEVDKYCMQVDGLDPDLPDKIIFGPKGEKQLISIFGQVDIEELAEKIIDLVPQPVKIAGKQRVSITFRKPQGEAPLNETPTAPSQEEEIPF